MSDKVELKGVVTDVCRGGNFRVRVEIAEGEEREILAYGSGKIRKYQIKIVTGDEVMVELSPYDLERGRIVYRDK